MYLNVLLTERNLQTMSVPRCFLRTCTHTNFGKQDLQISAQQPKTAQHTREYLLVARIRYVERIRTLSRTTPQRRDLVRCGRESGRNIGRSVLFVWGVLVAGKRVPPTEFPELFFETWKRIKTLWWKSTGPRRLGYDFEPNHVDWEFFAKFSILRSS